MATFRERPYAQFNFRVLIAEGPNPDSPQAGFQEVSGLGIEVSIAEHRAGNFKDNTPQKITGNFKVPDVTLKRGLIGDPATLFGWMKAVRDGQQNQLKTVTIQLMSEDHNTTPVQQWKLTNARPMKYTGPALTGKGTDIAIEELVLASERIDVI
jgi:phage tail-like protein